MPARPRLLDLFCGAGGAAAGYQRAGFDIIGVDIEDQPNYPFRFVRSDWEEALALIGPGVDVVHASPPCQRYSTLVKQTGRDYPDLYGPVRGRLQEWGGRWIIENVIGAPYRSGIVLCGSMFGLRVRRHRNFETSDLLLAPDCRHREQGRPVGVYGTGGAHIGRHSFKVPRREWAAIMGMPWATADEIAQAIPPCYTEWIGKALCGG